MKKIVLTLLCVFSLSAYAETIFLSCIVSGDVISTYRTDKLSSSTVSVEITKLSKVLTIIISGGDDYRQSASNRPFGNTEISDLSDNNSFNIVNSRVMNNSQIRAVSTHIQVNRVTGIITVSNDMWFDGGNFRKISYSGGCQKHHDKKF